MGVHQTDEDRAEKLQVFLHLVIQQLFSEKLLYFWALRRESNWRLIVLELHHLFSFLAGHVAYAIIVPQPGTEPGLFAVKVQSPNHWTAKEFPTLYSF